MRLGSLYIGHFAEAFHIPFTVPVSPQGQQADVGEERNRPGLLAHGGGWAHFSWLTWRRAALAGQRSPAELTFFCPAPSTHLGPPLAKETTTAAHDSCLRPSCLSVLSFVHRG